mmetsp:Transcript_24962/g.85559  ORF Transcript_24962/g.85559 Transcript_24962/m.85559 type:complete len:338 (+) Transcript_24962:897-1910(+)
MRVEDLLRVRFEDVGVDDGADAAFGDECFDAARAVSEEAARGEEIREEVLCCAPRKRLGLDEPDELGEVPWLEVGVCDAGERRRLFDLSGALSDHPHGDHFGRTAAGHGPEEKIRRRALGVRVDDERRVTLGEAVLLLQRLPRHQRQPWQDLRLEDVELDLEVRRRQVRLGHVAVVLCAAFRSERDGLACFGVPLPRLWEDGLAGLVQLGLTPELVLDGHSERPQRVHVLQLDALPQLRLAFEADGDVDVEAERAVLEFGFGRVRSLQNELQLARARRRLLPGPHVRRGHDLYEGHARAVKVDGAVLSLGRVLLKMSLFDSHGKVRRARAHGAVGLD